MTQESESESAQVPVVQRKLPHAPLWTSVARGIALFVGVFTLINLLAEWRTDGGYNANVWWIDLRPLRLLGLQQIAMFIVSIVFIAFALAPAFSPWRRRITTTTVELLWLLLGWNSIQYYILVAKGTINTPLPVPLTLLVAAVLFVIWRAAQSRWTPGAPIKTWTTILLTFAPGMLIVPVAEMVCFGLVDYRKMAGEADVIVVLGAGIHADGTPSEALRDRMETAIALFKEQQARYPEQKNLVMIVSGGQGADEPANEADVMKKMAEDALGASISPKQIIADTGGVDTRSTVRNCSPVFEEMDRKWVESEAKRDGPLEPVVLVVSHFYHLPRIKMTYWQADWHRVYTVPVRRPLVGLPYFMGRETAALWWHYLDMFKRTR